MGPLCCKDVHTGLWDCLGTHPATDRAKDAKRKGLGALSNKCPTPAVPGEQPCSRRAATCRSARSEGSTPSQRLPASAGPSHCLHRQSALMPETS